MNPYYARQQARLIGATGLKSEKRLAKKLNGRTRPASGALEGAKGDIELTTALVEAKSTVNDSLSLKYAWLDKIGREARAAKKTPALVVSFTNGDGRPVPHGEWVLVPLAYWMEYLKA